VKEEMYCALSADQRTIQARMDRQDKDGQGKVFQDLASDGFDPVSLWERVNRDMDLLRDLVELFAQEYPGLLSSIRAALEQGQFVDVQKLSHKMKGSALQFSGRLVVVAAGTLEEMGRTESLDGADKVMATLNFEVLRLMEALKMMVGSERPVM
jgi:two-component system sensor histidine kinase/response regulator